jgi:type I restriction enzyme S subunit
MQEEKQLLPKLRFTEFEGEWEKKKFSNYIKLYRGSSPRPINRYLTDDKNGVNWIKIGDTKKVVNYTLENVSEKITVRGSSKSRRVKKGELILANSMSYGKTYLLGIDGCIYDGWFVLREYEFFFDKTFLIQQLNSEYLQKQYKRLSTGGVVQNISSEIVYSTYLCKPKINEQQKIANFLTAIDNHIQTLEKKKTLLEQYKKGVLQKIFKQELRFKDDDGSDFLEWEKAHLGSFIKEYKSKSKVRNEFLVLTSSNKGLMLQSDYYGENRLTDRDNTGFNIIPKGYITFRSRSDNRKFTFNLNDLELTGLVSVYYPVFKSIGGSSKFIIELLNFSQNYIGKFSVGTSQTVLSFAQLSKIKFEFPSPEEQLKIANSLSAIDKNIALVTKKIEHTKTFKKGLLQQMFV